MINDFLKVIVGVSILILIVTFISFIRSCDRNLDGDLSLERIEKERVQVREKFDGAQSYEEICDIFNKQFCAD